MCCSILCIGPNHNYIHSLRNWCPRSIVLCIPWERRHFLSSRRSLALFPHQNSHTINCSLQRCANRTILVWSSRSVFADFWDIERSHSILVENVKIAKYLISGRNYLLVYKVMFTIMKAHLAVNAYCFLRKYAFVTFSIELLCRSPSF